MDLLFTGHCAVYELLIALSVVSFECPAVDHHSPGGNCGILNLIPTACRHQRLGDADPAAQGAHDALELIDRVAQLACGQDAEFSGLCGRRVSCLDPLGQKRYHVSLPEAAAVLLKLRLHRLPHLILERSADQAVEVIVSSVDTDQIQIRTQCLRMHLRHVADDSPESFALAQSPADIAGVEGDSGREQRILMICLGEEALDADLFRTAKRTDHTEQIKSCVACGVQCHSAVFCACKNAFISCCLCKLHYSSFPSENKPADQTPVCHCR